MNVEYFSERGRHRQENQDALAYWSTNANLREGFIAVVADGVGSMMFGQDAAKIAADTSLDFLRSVVDPNQSSADLTSEIASSLEAASHAIKEFSLERVGDPYKSGACALCVVCQGDIVQIGGIGDCFAYTVDESGNVGSFAGEQPVGGSVVGGVLGSKGDVQPMFSRWNIERRARIGIATDGIADYFPMSKLIERASDWSVDLKCTMASTFTDVVRADPKDNFTLLMAEY